MADMMEMEQELDSGIGVTSWLVEGMKIQETQLRDLFTIFACLTHFQ